MSKYRFRFGADAPDPGENDPSSPRRGGGRGDGALLSVPAILMILLAAAVVYGAYFWFYRRVVVGPNEVLVLLKKDGGRSLPGDQIVIPRPPVEPKRTDEAYQADPEQFAVDHADWQKDLAAWHAAYDDTNGILEQVYQAGTYFAFSPFDYEREVIDIRQSAEVPAGKVGIVIKKFGAKLPDGQVLADPALDQRGPLPAYLAPGRHYAFANPYAYEIKQVDPITVDPGHRGVITYMAGPKSQQPNQYMVADGEQGVQRGTETEGFFFVNPFVQRITPISIRSQRFEMMGDDTIQFPSSDSFDIKLEGFVEWSIMPDRLAETYVKYSEGNELIPLVEKTMILPYARSFSRLVGSQYSARDFISGDTKLKFQDEFEAKLREACAAQGIEILQALVRDIIPPEAIKQPINEREIAREQILQYDQQIKVAQSMADLATQEEMGKQNQAIGDANREVVTVIKQAEQTRDVALTRAQQDLAVAKLHLEAAQKQADALIARGEAEANVVLLQRQAEAEPLARQVQAFGDGESYARFFFNQKLAPSIKTILTNTDGPMADLFRQFTAPPPDATSASPPSRAASSSSPGQQPEESGQMSGVNHE